MENTKTTLTLNPVNLEMIANLLATKYEVGVIGCSMEEGFPIYTVNKQMVDMLGYDSIGALVEGIKGSVTNLIWPEDLERFRADIGTTAFAGKKYSSRYRMVCKDKSPLWVQADGEFLATPDGVLVGICLCTRASQMEEMKIEDRGEKLYLEILDHTGEMIQIADRNTYELLYANKPSLAFAGLKDSYHGETCYEFLMGLNAPCRECPLREGNGYGIAEVYNGRTAYQIRSIPILWKGHESIMECAQDITGIYLMKKKFEQLSTRDALTGLYNRNYFLLCDFEKEEMLPCGYMLFDLNDLKKVNDQGGHEQGDIYIVNFVRLLKQVMPDSATIIRYGGDEFLVILPGYTWAKCGDLLRSYELLEAAQKREPFRVSAAGGYAVRDSLRIPEGKVIAKADDNMYRKKREQKKG